MPRKFSNVNNMNNFGRVTSFTNYDIYRIVPKPSRKDLLMLFTAHAVDTKRLSENLT